MKIIKKIGALLLMLAIGFGGLGMLTEVRTSAAANLEYVAMNDSIRQSVAAYARTYAAHQASSSGAVLSSNKNSMMPVRSSGNCATFVSSSLAYAGIPYDNQGSNKWQEISSSFASTSAIGSYLKNNSGEGNGIKATRIKSGAKITGMSKSDWSSLKVGDVVCMTMSGGGGHTVVVVQEGDSMSTVQFASNTRDGIYNFGFWKNAVSRMDIFRIQGFYRTASSGTKKAIHKTGQKSDGLQIAYLKSKSTGAALTTQGYRETGTGNVAYSLRTDLYYPGLDSFSSSSASIKSRTKRIIALGITSADDSVALFNAKLGLSGSDALKNETEAVSATQLAVWVSQGQLTLSKYNCIGTAGERVLKAVNTLLDKSKNTLGSQATIQLSGTSKIKLSDKSGMVLVGPFNSNTAFAYRVALTSNAGSAFSCDSKGTKTDIFKAGEAFYLMLPPDSDGLAVGVQIHSSRYRVEYSAWQAGSTQPLVLADASEGKRLAFGVTMSREADSVVLGDEPPGLVLSQTKKTLMEGDKMQLLVTRYGAAAQNSLSWSSSDPAVANVTAKGVVTAVRAGKATITAEAAGITAQCTVTVKEAPQGVSLRINSKKAIVDGKLTTIDTNGSTPFISNGRTMIPLRFSSEKMGAKVKWTSNSKPITITLGKSVVTLTVGSRTITVTKNGNSVKKTIDQAAQLKNGRVYVPLRAVSENLGFSVKYDDDSRVIVITEYKLSSTELSDRVKAAKASL